MIEFIALPANEPFAWPLMFVLALSALEVFGMLLGNSLSHFIDGLIPDLDIDVDIDIEVDGDVSDIGVLTSFLNIYRGKGGLPVLIVFMFMGIVYSTTGLITQYFYSEMFSGFLPGIVIIPVGLAGMFIITPMITRPLSLIMPHDETYITSAGDFLGRPAKISQGVARHDLSAEAKLVDDYGTVHYVKVVPHERSKEYGEGVYVLIVGKDEKRNVFLVEEADSEIVSLLNF